ncbi:MAG: N-acetylmuramidase domain-containing protein [Lachnospiraceae bacterium]|nr:N-acetylmuramidase domain-containing protein [Lachnospiraceae bacterium]
MGDNYAIIGFSSAEEMYNEMSAFYENQIEAMVCYIKKLGLDQGTVKELIRKSYI